MKEVIDSFKKLRENAEALDVGILELMNELGRAQETKAKALAKISDMLRIEIDKSQFENFLKQPYALIPSKKDEWYVPVPKFIRMNLGWLEFSTPTYNVFKINKFMSWLGELPKDMEKKFEGKMKLPLKLFDGMLLTGEHQEEAWNRFKKYLTRREGKDKIRIKSGYEFKLLAELIDNGILPFIPQPVQAEDMQKTPINFELRDYQREAWERFKQTGAIGVFWAYSAGKTYLGLKALSRIKGDKLVVVPTTTLVEQWRERLKQHTSVFNEVAVMTYHSFKYAKNKEWSLIVFDECHRLPANQFSRFATLKTKYRIGLSGSPFREDGRENYIFALTGFPIGVSWESLIEEGIIEEPDIVLYVLKDWKAKEDKLTELLGQDKKTIIFCDSISLGKRLSNKFEIPFVYGQTKDRLEVIRESQTTLVSRVGDEGISISELERVIEVDFLFGSRRQEAQRMGRLFHGDVKGEHYIIMTEAEYEKHGKRLYAIMEKGFKIEMRR